MGILNIGIEKRNPYTNFTALLSQEGFFELVLVKRVRSPHYTEGQNKKLGYKNLHLQGVSKAVQFGVVAAFSFITGEVKEAPKWMQQTCLEWLSH